MRSTPQAQRTEPAAQQTGDLISSKDTLQLEMVTMLFPSATVLLPYNPRLSENLFRSISVRIKHPILTCRIHILMVNIENSMKS